MTIIVDAYNFIKHISGATFISERNRLFWMDRFSDYVLLRNNEVILVFDAGPGLYKTAENYKNISIIYSGQRDSADDVIKTWLSSRHGKDILLVTSDREIRDFANSCNIVSISSEDFNRIFSDLMERQEKQQEQVVKTVYKTSQEEVQGLDELMELGSRYLVESELDKHYVIMHRAKNGKKASKQDKRLMKKIEKI